MTESAMRRPRRRTLTDKMVAALPRKPKPYFHPDPELPKHGVRVRPTGPGTFTVVVRDPFGKQRWVKIGTAAELKIEAAREQARTAIARIRQGLDPFEPPPVRPDTTADVVATYLKRHVEARGLRTADEVRRVLEVYVLPHWRDRPFAEIGAPTSPSSWTPSRTGTGPGLPTGRSPPCAVSRVGTPPAMTITRRPSSAA